MSAANPSLANEMAPTASIQVIVVDGTRQKFTGRPLLLTINDGNQKTRLRSFFSDTPITVTELPVFNNAGDNYTVLVSTSHSIDAGFFPVKVAAGAKRAVKLMLLPKDGSVNFAGARWRDLPATWQAILADEPQYNDLLDYQNGLPSASLLNLFTSMQLIALGSGQTPLNFLRGVIWDRSGPQQIAQDRFFGWADPKLIPELEQARRNGTFAEVPANLHPGATRSYKQTQFGEANLQLTFHENDRDGKGNVLIEPDIDYYKDPLAHIFLEVLVNAFGSLTDPREVLALRWMAAAQAGAPEFNPLYTVQSA